MKTTTQSNNAQRERGYILSLRTGKRYKREIWKAMW